METIFRGGTIIDGSGDDPFEGDVAVSDGRIGAVGAAEGQGVREIDVTGLVVAPGFIDIHSHSDYTLIADPRAVSAIHQGVTLEVIGNCGHGCFPVKDADVAKRAVYGYHESVPFDWSTAAEYLGRLEQARPAVNVLSLVPNGQLRLSVVGLESRPARRDELAIMTRMLEQSLEEGAWGFSTGLEYATEAGVPERDIEHLCRSVARYDGFYATHTRWRDDHAVEAVEEAIRTAERAGVRLQVSHIVPRGGERDSELCMAAVEKAHANGLDVAFDMHTRLFGFTFLSTALPAWALEGGRAAVLAALRDPSARERMKEHRGIISAGKMWDRITLLRNDVWPEYGGRDLASIAVERGQEPLDFVYDLLLEGGETMDDLMVLIWCYTEQQQRDSFGHPLCMPGSDATTLAPSGPLKDDVFFGAYTWAAWFYEFMVRTTGLLKPAEAVRRLTAFPAERIGLDDRGVLRVGARADLAVFDGRVFGGRGTVDQPNRLAEGMRHVMVNGVLTLEEGALTGARAGTVIRRGES